MIILFIIVIHVSCGVSGFVTDDKCNCRKSKSMGRGTGWLNIMWGVALMGSMLEH